MPVFLDHASEERAGGCIHEQDRLCALGFCPPLPPPLPLPLLTLSDPSQYRNHDSQRGPRGENRRRGRGRSGITVLPPFFLLSFPFLPRRDHSHGGLKPFPQNSWWDSKRARHDPRPDVFFFPPFFFLLPSSGGGLDAAQTKYGRSKGRSVCHVPLFSFPFFFSPSSFAASGRCSKAGGQDRKVHTRHFFPSFFPFPHQGALVDYRYFPILSDQEVKGMAGGNNVFAPVSSLLLIP